MTATMTAGLWSLMATGKTATKINDVVKVCGRHFCGRHCLVYSVAIIVVVYMAILVAVVIVYLVAVIGMVRGRHCLWPSYSTIIMYINLRR